ncbi:MAG: hypothetical protein AAB680_05960 [Pseudomonadota bacterium]
MSKLHRFAAPFCTIFGNKYLANTPVFTAYLPPELAQNCCGKFDAP